MKVDVVKAYTQPAFLICVALLAIAGAAMERVHVEKVAFPLKRSLDLLDESSLTPYKVISKERIGNEEVIKSLGTEDYIQCVLEDTDVPADSDVRKCFLFITYYKLPDKVPHVPEECYIGSGHQRLASDNMTFVVNKYGSEQKILGRHLVFESTSSGYWGTSEKFSVLYLINVNGVYTNSREGARWLLNKNIFSKHVYFCKVEWNFLSASGDRTYPKKEEAVAASQKLLGVILPILEKEHWPNQSTVNSK
ncbi:MAG: hypothetical protein ACYSTG_00550 [Planctomycetota bacterium]|jgi:hypothetical protein